MPRCFDVCVKACISLYVPQAHYKEQIDQVKKGRRVSELIAVSMNELELSAAPVRHFPRSNKPVTFSKSYHEC